MFTTGIRTGKMAIGYFVPGTAAPAAGLLGGLLPTWPEGVAKHFVEAYTHPDAIVLDPFAVSEVSIHEALAAGRRVIATNNNPLVVLALRERLSPPDPDGLKAAVTRLGDSLKLGTPLREHLNQLYRTRCPTCRQPAVAEYFVWSREPADPRQKWVDCPACGQGGLAAVGDDDLAVLDDVETRGLHYRYLLDRVASPPDSEARAHAETLQELYTPRALYAIADLLMRIEATFDEEIQAHLKAVLLTCLGPASNLYAPDTQHLTPTSSGEDPSRPALDKLQPPPRFTERNVWRLFEASVQQLATSASRSAPVPLQADVHWATRLLPSPQGLVWVHKLGVGAIGRGLTPGSVSLVLSIPPRPNPVFWSLAFLWTGWLYGTDEATRLKSLALRKWPDWAWYQSAMANALRALRPVFRFDGTCVLVLHGSPSQQAFALVLAALAADYVIESWQHRATGEHQYTLTPGCLRAPSALGPEDVRPRVVAESAKAAINFVRARGAPIQTEALHIAAWHRLMRKGILEMAQASQPTSRLSGWLNTAISEGLESAQRTDLIPVSDDGDRPMGWWLRKVGRGVASPLGDRVEDAVLAALRDSEKGEPLEETEFVGSIYRHFSGPLTPDAGLVRACLKAYGEEMSPGHWRLHPRERQEAWQGRKKAAMRDLLALGERLGYHTRQERKGFDVAWEEEGHTWAIYNLTATAHVAGFLPHLARTLPQAEIRWRNLVIPAARTSLWQHKLATQPWLLLMIKAGGWTFIKLEHVHTLAAKDTLTRHELKAMVGLVPPVESGEGQLPLF